MRWVTGALSGALVLIILATGLFVLVQEAYRAPGPLVAPRTVIIESGQGVIEIAQHLQAEGVIASPLLFRAAARLRGIGGSLRAGEYAFPAAISLEDVLRYLLEGETVVRRLTVPEGWTVDAVIALLRDTEGLDGTLAATPPEGSILPDTYHYSYGDARQAVLDRMTEAMDRYLADAWEQRAADLPLETPRQALTLASIVEKETALPEERPLVAAVFVNRLRRGMKLQADPTVVYGLEREQGPLDRPLTRRDLRIDTPYNTYVIEGLPPGPIANPGREAIRAVLNPADSDYLYFVADGKGGHAFARTLEEHNKNVAEWRRTRAKEAP